MDGRPEEGEEDDPFSSDGWKPAMVGFKGRLDPLYGRGVRVLLKLDSSSDLDFFL